MYLNLIAGLGGDTEKGLTLTLDVFKSCLIAPRLLLLYD